MAKITIEVPDIGEFTDVPVIDVYIKAGDEISPDDALISLESAKAVMDVPSTEGGTVLEVVVKEGDKVSQGDKIAVIEAAETEKAQEEEPEDEEKPEETEEPAEQKEKPVEKEEKPSEKEVPVNRQEPGAVHHATPSTRQFARRVGVDLSSVKGTGEKGRILTEDVETYIKASLKSGGGAFSLPAIPEADFSSFGPVEEHELTRIQKISGPHIHKSWVGVPHVTQYDEADVTELEEFRRSLRDQGEKHSILSFVIPAVVRALKEFPDFNASLHSSGERVIRKKYYHIGIAVDTPQGLVVPVLKDADTKSIGEITGSLRELSDRAREGKLKPSDIQGGSFSISSLGGIGGTGFTPIINVPEAAILGLSRIEKKPRWDEARQAFVPRLVLPFSVSYDHRVIDGASGARFAVYLGSLLSDIRRVLL